MKESTGPDSMEVVKMIVRFLFILFKTGFGATEFELYWLNSFLTRVAFSFLTDMDPDFSYELSLSGSRSEHTKKLLGLVIANTFTSYSYNSY